MRQAGKLETQKSETVPVQKQLLAEFPIFHYERKRDRK
jgi:hypothetical protein